MRDSLTGTRRQAVVFVAAWVALCLLPASAFGLPVSIGKHSQISRVAQASDGHIFVAGSTEGCPKSFTSCRTSLPLIAAYTAAGHLDTSFGDDGIVVESSANDTLNAADEIGVQSDGKVVVKVVEESPDYSAVLQRFNPDGTRDMTFGDAGEVDLSTSCACSMVVEPNDKITVLINAYSQATSTYSIVLERFTADGQPDPDFGAAGVAAIPQDSDSYDGHDLKQDSQGRYVVLAGEATGSDFTTAVLRIDSAGDLDTTFGGGDGEAPVSVEHGIDDESESAVGLAVAPDDGVLVGFTGSSVESHGCWSGGVSRVDSAGSLDTSLPGGGQGVFDCAMLHAVAVSDEGRIYTISQGYSIGGTNERIDVIAEKPDRSYYRAFGGTGGVAVPLLPGYSEPSDLIPEQDGGVLVAGSAESSSHDCVGGDPVVVGHPCGGMLLARYDRHGVLEPAFGKDGVSVVPRFTTCRFRGAVGRVILPKKGRRVEVKLRYRAYASGSITASFRTAPHNGNTVLFRATIKRSANPVSLTRFRLLSSKELHVLRSEPQGLQITFSTFNDRSVCVDRHTLIGDRRPPASTLKFR